MTTRTLCLLCATLPLLFSKTQAQQRFALVREFAHESVDAQALPTWTLVRELRIGALDGPDALTFVGSVLADAQRRIFVAQPQENVVKVFGATGRLELQIGRKGAGPGEFSSLGPLQWRNDTILIFDDQLQ